MRFDGNHTYSWCIRYKDNPSEKVFRGRTGHLHRTAVHRHIKIRKGAGFLTVPSQATGLYIRFKRGLASNFRETIFFRGRRNPVKWLRFYDKGTQVQVY